MITNAVALIICVVISLIENTTYAVLIHGILLEFLTLSAYVIYIIVCSIVGLKLNAILTKNYHINRVLSLKKTLSTSKDSHVSSDDRSNSLNSNNSIKRLETMKTIKGARNGMFYIVLFFGLVAVPVTS